MFIYTYTIKGHNIGILLARLSIFLFITVIFLFSCFSTSFAADLTSVTTIPWNSDISTSTKHTVDFTTATSLPNDGKIVITFPAGFNVSSATFDRWSDFDGSQTLSINSQIITITRDGSGTATTAGAKYIILNNITNHATAAFSYTTSVEIQDSGGANIDGPTNSSTFSTTVTGDELDPTAPWPKFLRDHRNTGYSNLPGPDYPTLAWVYSNSPQLKGGVQDNNGIFYSFDNVDKKIYALNANGTLVWSTSMTISDTSKFALSADNTLYVVIYDGINVKLYALNTTDGSVKWSSSETGLDTYLYGINIGADGTIYPAARYTSRAFNSDGTLKWSVSRNGRDSTPGIDFNTGLIHVAGDGFAGNYYLDGKTNVSYGPSMTTVNIDSSGNVFYPQRTNNPVVSYTSSGTLRWSTGSDGSDSATGALSPDENTWYFSKSGIGLKAYRATDGEVFVE